MKPVIFKNKRQDIFGILDMPKAKKEVPLVVFCHGWTGNHLGTWNSFFNQAAKGLVKEGFAVLRFDFRGSGDSDGIFEKQTTSSMLSDLNVVINQTVKKEGIDRNRVALIGHSQGAYIALLHAAKDKRVKALISWMGRISDYKDFVSKIWVEEAKRKGYIEAWAGYEVKYNPFIKDTFKYNSEKALSKLRIPFGLLYGKADDTVPISEGELAKRLTKGKAEIKILQNLTHDFTGKQGIQREVISITSKWLKRWL
ncbi:MAG: alpha/beta fold hydrolase [Patescibacteria group bacterium]|nr:alpha/beta fold hydrolase [Patescibacteria group bacterium]